MSIQFWSTVICVNKMRTAAAVRTQKLEPVCCKKQQKKVPDQLLVCGIGNL